MQGDVRLTMARDGLLVGVPIHAERPVPALVVAGTVYLGVMNQLDNPVTAKTLQLRPRGGCRRVHLAPRVRLDLGLDRDGMAGPALLRVCGHTGAEEASMYVQRTERPELRLEVYPQGKYTLMLDGRLCTPDSRSLEHPVITDEVFVPAELPTLLSTYALLGVNVHPLIAAWAGVFAHVAAHALAGRPLNEDGGG